jgi:hypothetical protein
MKTQRNSSMLIYLLLSCIIINTVHTIKISKMKLETEQDDGAASKIDGAKLAGECMKGLVANIPPSFCWKKGADSGIIPTLCPNGFFRSLALCFEYCKPGYRHVLGICYEDCPRGFADFGLFCFRWFEFRGKGIYVPRSLTNFSHEVPCYEGMYRVGALCYRNCENINMENCGIGACVSDQAACSSAIVNMVVSTLSSIADIVLLIFSFGSSASISEQKQQLTSSIKKIGQQGLKASTKAALKSLKGRFQKDIIKKALSAVKNYAKDSIFSALKSNFISAYCSTVYETAINKADPDTTFNLDTVVGALDVLNLKGIIQDCSNTSEGGLNCAKNVLTGLSTFDPTGLLGVTTAFMHPECDVPTTIVKQIDPPDELNILTLGECEQKCEDAINHCVNAPVNKGYEKECRTLLPVCKTRCNVEVCSESCQYKERHCLGESLFDKNFCANQKILCHDEKCKKMSQCASDCDNEVKNCEINNPNSTDRCHWVVKHQCYINCNKNNSISTDNKKFYGYFQACIDHVQQCKNAPVNKGYEKLCENILPNCNTKNIINMCTEGCRKKEEECLSLPSTDKQYCSKSKSQCLDKYCNKISTCVSNCDTQAIKCENDNKNNQAVRDKCQLELKFDCYRICETK